MRYKRGSKSYCHTLRSARAVRVGEACSVHYRTGRGLGAYWKRRGATDERRSEPGAGAATGGYERATRTEKSSGGEKIRRAPTATVHTFCCAGVRSFDTSRDPVLLILSAPINIDAGSFVLQGVFPFLLHRYSCALTFVWQILLDFFLACNRPMYFH